MISNKVKVLRRIMLQVPEVIVDLVMPAVSLALVFIEMLVYVIDCLPLPFRSPQLNKGLVLNASEGRIFIMLVRETGIGLAILPEVDNKGEPVTGCVAPVAVEIFHAPDDKRKILIG